MGQHVADCQTTDRAPLLIGAKEVARLLGRSERSVWRDEGTGRLPQPVRLGGSKRWRLAEIRAWVEAGCPDRRNWQQIRAAVRSGRS